MGFIQDIKKRALGAKETITNFNQVRKSNNQSTKNLNQAAKKFALKGTGISESDMVKGMENTATGKIKQIEQKRQQKRKEYKNRFNL